MVRNLPSDFAALKSVAVAAPLLLSDAATWTITKNGEGDLVVMDIETYNRREKMLKLREELLAVEEDRLAGRTGCSLDELESYLDNIIEEG